MKIILILLATLLTIPTFPAYSKACKCNCNPTSLSLCAPNYDLDNPCEGVCRVAPGVGVMIAACPTMLVVHPLSRVKRWVTVCPED